MNRDKRVCIIYIIYIYVLYSVLPRPFWRIGPISLTCGRDVGRYALRMYSTSLVPRPFSGGGKNGLVYTVDACALFPQKQGNSCTFENPPFTLT